MKAVLVAGGAGYIGAQTCKQLAASGFLPVTIDNISTGYRQAVKWGPLVEADIRDRYAIAGTVAKYDIRAAMHFAACSLVGESMQNPVKYYDNNVGAAVSFASSLIENGVKNLIFSSTAAVYGLPKTMLISEDHPAIPINPYGATKLAFEQALHWIACSSDLRFTILRYFNASGADLDGEVGESHDPETHLIPLLCKAVIGSGAPLSIFGSDYPTPDGTPIRDYIHVVDLAAAHVAALQRMLSGGGSGIFNVGTGVGATVAEVIRTAESILAREIPYRIGPRREGDPAVLVADPSRILHTLDWSPRFSDLRTIIQTAMWWQENRFY
ncbi:UDP-glucose 4-epimerase GalE [Zavarzinia compransoris]|uniref:UDP-glucose 4-epimerase n=1 Tax=Zavarzinia compransoris TaxID=1264899 RepID=A0A317DUZ7_9PROT|nr:UDP-glucose 4-epimerase GalE [Zavarzinia compransoris]PWR18214.1 UDP-glucose 4-epimerase GalE [Zavarzinia compransoris]TDP40894.1 UDP-glucose 4-epimerase/UDP-arabinose 4-epimerase [Zavarzinia compransoris]